MPRGGVEAYGSYGNGSYGNRSYGNGSYGNRSNDNRYYDNQSYGYRGYQDCRYDTRRYANPRSYAPSYGYHGDYYGYRPYGYRSYAIPYGDPAARVPPGVEFQSLLRTPLRGRRLRRRGGVRLLPHRPRLRLRLGPVVDAPPDAQVFVDGYYAGVVDDYDGVFQHLNLVPGSHRIDIQVYGYQPIGFDVFVQPGQTITYRANMY